MAILPIVTGQDSPVLRTKTQEVPKVTKEIKKLIKDMGETVVHADGLGLAAPQIDISLRLCLCQIGKRMTPIINPYITWKSEHETVLEEGCLSLPKINVEVWRPDSVIVNYMDEKGNKTERKLTGMDAKVVQHEVDHLNGILIVDYM